MWDAPRIRLHLSIVESLNAYVPCTETCRGHPMNHVSASSSQTPLVPILRTQGMEGLDDHERDGTIDREPKRSSYHCATRALIREYFRVRHNYLCTFFLSQNMMVKRIHGPFWEYVCSSHSYRKLWLFFKLISFRFCTGLKKLPSQGLKNRFLFAVGLCPVLTNFLR
ncbi:hypothetical protein Y032_0342g3039 [Ancylostoma ceylanicum]|uniref:Uncharacterized protein n=1 Tax=Ancylostoma ceylanicum TaxID=53326 RepID=A0A016RXM5_9BILA|nr:hypothetical protein Y032_0342g3039 [Ancylostoma ceylanicum]